jgi:transcriptional regulator with XRE-family HTH domain
VITPGQRRYCRFEVCRIILEATLHGYSHTMQAFVYEKLSAPYSRMAKIIIMGSEESAVCQRLASARRFSGLSQEELANAIGITRDQLTNIETGRAVLGFVIGWKACKRLGVNQLYLASGSHPITPFRDVGPLEDLPSPNASFREACIMGPIADLLNLLDASTQRAGPGESMRAYEKGAASLVRTFLLRLPEDSYPQLLDSIYAALRTFEESLRARKSRVGRTKKECKLTVDELTGPATMADVTSESGYWKALVKRVRALTAEPGEKAKLARELNTTRQAVNKWLSGNGAPSAEVTLRLLHWVGQREQK